ncbi:peptidylprolyl isomerase [uncultured Rubinisphaera sp.]|uniref:peptidylprolyl isomerase n=1 Tax=uncultured Rubinisphaera sp. TaxID=1678686 RepID=UPI0030D7424B
MNELTTTVLLTFIGLSIGIAQPITAFAQQSRLAAEVNGKVITEHQINEAMKTLGVYGNDNRETFERMRERLIERTLIDQFLKSRGITAPKLLVERRMNHVEKILAQEDDPDQALENLHLTREQLRKEISLPLAWQRYVRQVVTDGQISEYFQQHQQELDGTKRTVSQIFLKLPRDASESEVEIALRKLRNSSQMVGKNGVSFADVARRMSEAPTAEQGGLIGTFAFTGQMPRQIVEVAFQTPEGEMSEPFRSIYGVHLLKVDKVIPGQLTPEDARPQILEHFDQQLWQETVKRLKAEGNIIYFELP